MGKGVPQLMKGRNLFIFENGPGNKKLSARWEFNPDAIQIGHHMRNTGALPDGKKIEFSGPSDTFLTHHGHFPFPFIFFSFPKPFQTFNVISGIFISSNSSLHLPCSRNPPLFVSIQIDYRVFENGKTREKERERETYKGYKNGKYKMGLKLYL